MPWTGGFWLCEGLLQETIRQAAGFLPIGAEEIGRRSDSVYCRSSSVSSAWTLERRRKVVAGYGQHDEAKQLRHGLATLANTARCAWR